MKTINNLSLLQVLSKIVKGIKLNNDSIKYSKINLFNHQLKRIELTQILKGN